MAHKPPTADNRRMPGHRGGSSLRASQRPARVRRRRWLIALGVGAAALPIAAAAATFPPPVIPSDQDIVVHVKTAGAEVLVDVDCPVQAPPRLVWDVLTDYDNMARFISNLQTSGIEQRTGNVLKVRQTGKVNRGIFSFAFDNVREIELIPLTEIRSRLVSGDFKASAFTTRLVEIDGVVHVVNSGRYTPNLWVPPLLGPALIEGETRRQYGEIRTEILRRAAHSAATSASTESIAFDDHGNETRFRR